MRIFKFKESWKNVGQSYHKNTITKISIGKLKNREQKIQTVMTYQF